MRPKTVWLGFYRTSTQDNYSQFGFWEARA